MKLHGFKVENDARALAQVNARLSGKPQYVYNDPTDLMWYATDARPNGGNQRFDPPPTIRDQQCGHCWSPDPDGED